MASSSGSGGSSRALQTGPWHHAEARPLAGWQRQLTQHWHRRRHVQCGQRIPPPLVRGLALQLLLLLLLPPRARGTRGRRQAGGAAEAADADAAELADVVTVLR